MDCKSQKAVHILCVQIPDSIGQLENLEILGLERNNLEFLNPAVCKIEGLQRLGLSGNAMTNLPREIENLVCLEQLLLDDNEFEFIPIQVSVRC